MRSVFVSFLKKVIWKIVPKWLKIWSQVQISQRDRSISIISEYCPEYHHRIQRGKFYLNLIDWEGNFVVWNSTIYRVFRSQGGAKLLAVKVEGLKKKSAIQPRPHSNQLARVRGGPGSNHSQTLMAGKFAALWPTDPRFLELKENCEKSSRG